MLQPKLLREFAPHSLQLVYHPHDTGSPNFDLNSHLDQFANRRVNVVDLAPGERSEARKHPIYTGNIGRIDTESTQLIGDRVIGRVEFDLGPANEAELQHRILTILYAEKQFGNVVDAAEFVRVIKEAVGAGVEADPRSLQIWASWAYDEIRARTKSNRPKAEVITEVLKELALLAMQLTAVTSTKEDRLAEEPEVIEFYGSAHYSDELNPTERQRLFETRCEEILDHQDTSSPYTAELRSICSKISRSHSSGNVYDEEAQFQEYLGELIDAGDSDGKALQQSHERVTEQYDEGGVVSLHMSESEKFIVEGTLDEDIDESYLPSHISFLAAEVKELFLEGMPLYSNNSQHETIDAYIDFRLDQAYGNPSDKAYRVPRTVRTITSSKTDGLVEYCYRASAYSNREERQYVREVIEQILSNLRRDFIFNCMNRSKTFRTFMLQIENALETRGLIQTIKDAYQARLKGSISIKMFTALNTMYELRRANIESTPMRETREVAGQTRLYIVSAPTLALARDIKTKDLRQLSTALQALPMQERERIRTAFKHERTDLYRRVFEGLLDIVATASEKKVLYLRFAFYENPGTGKANEAHNMIHLLVSEDKARVWEALKEASKLPKPLAA